MDEVKELLDLILDINDKFFEQSKDFLPSITIQTDNTTCLVKLHTELSEIILWNSEQDDRIFDEETNSYEDWIKYFERILQLEINKLLIVRFKI